MQDWLAQLGAVRGASPKTLIAYRRDVAGYLGFLAGHWGGPAGAARLAAVSTEDLRAWMAHERGRGLSARSLARGAVGGQELPRLARRGARAAGAGGQRHPRAAAQGAAAAAGGAGRGARR